MSGQVADFVRNDGRIAPEHAIWTPRDVNGISNSTLNTLLVKDKESWSAVTISFCGIDLIIHNPIHSAARQSSDIMHELSHLILGHKPDEIMFLLNGEKIVLREYNEEFEEEAKWLAGCLLLPREAILKIGWNGLNTADACSKYGVSVDLLTYRTNMTGVKHQLGRKRYSPVTR